MTRGDLLKTITAMTALSSLGLKLHSKGVGTQGNENLRKEYNFKLSLNAYSFNQPLSDGSMDLFDLLDFCSDQGFDAVDPTGYYFPGYPEVPSDEYLYEFKRAAFLKGLAISGTGIRNEFVDPDEQKRRHDVQLIKQWIRAASKMGAPILRIFTGHHDMQEYTREQTLEWMIKDIKECVDYGSKHGIVVAVQNHNAFIKTAVQTRELMEGVDSKWFGLILDTGSFRQGDPYQEVADAIPWAVSWQLKELIYVNSIAENIDLDKIFNIIKAAGYRGYIPIETLGPGDPFVKVSDFLKQVRLSLAIS